MKEKDFQTKFTRWYKYKWPGTGVFELKLTKERSIPFDAVAPHQVMWLFQAKNNKIGYKLPDTGYSQKPFDFFGYKGPAYVVIMYYQKGVKHFYLIDIDVWIEERDKSTRKSLVEARAKEIGVRHEFN